MLATRKKLINNITHRVNKNPIFLTPTQAIVRPESRPAVHFKFSLIHLETINNIDNLNLGVSDLINERKDQILKEYTLLSPPIGEGKNFYNNKRFLRISKKSSPQTIRHN